MINRMIMLVRREFWEHRALWIAPVTIAGLILGAFTILMLTSGLVRGIGFETLVAGMDAVGANGVANGINVLIVSPVPFINIGLMFTVFFYCLDALYAERKDKSILFWRSLPITDTETVVSKVLTAVIGAPLIAFAVLALVQVGILILSTIFVWLGDGSAWEHVWRPVSLADTWLMSLFSLVAGSLWALPFVGWLLLCSAYVRKSPFLWAVLPFFVIPMLEAIFSTGHFFIRHVWGHFGQFYATTFRVSEGTRHISISDSSGSTFRFDPADFVDPTEFLLAPRLWVGLAVGAALIAAAVYVRRYRPDVES